jgi:hypothetical protein
MVDIFSGPPLPVRRQELEAASRQTDPASSKRAAREIERSGALKGQRLIALNLVEQYPGKTSKELSQLGTLDRYQLARRLADLLKEHRVRRVETQAEDCRWWSL